MAHRGHGAALNPCTLWQSHALPHWAMAPTEQAAFLSLRLCLRLCNPVGWTDFKQGENKHRNLLANPPATVPIFRLFSWIRRALVPNKRLTRFCKDYSRDAEKSQL